VHARVAPACKASRVVGEFDRRTPTARHDGFDYAIAIQSSGRAGQDRATVVHVRGGLIIALADGAGGTAHGAEAAEAVITAVQARPALDPTELLYELDDPERLGHGQATAVIAAIHGDTISGASVGDSGLWLIETSEVTDVTHAQRRKPLLGDGCDPVAFRHGFASTTTLLVASDGLLRYAKLQEIARVARGANLDDAAASLIELVRLPTGDLQDDVSIVLCRRAPA
jgi:serine/threonine protein phosphatase PrpC